MPCLTPLTLYRKKRNFDDNHTDVVPCGLCPYCKQQRSYHWQFRLQQEQKISTSSTFLTLTYEKEPLTKYQNPTLKKVHLQNFFKRLRKKLIKDQFPNNPIKYYAVGEYGSITKRPHYHVIMFNLPHEYLYQYDIIEKIWTHGLIQIDKCENASIAYVSNYINNSSTHYKELPDVQNEFALMSKKMGLNHLTPEMINHYRENLSDSITHSGGKKSILPRYFKEKLFTRSELKIITANNKILAEENNRFNNSYTELQWKKDQYRKAEKKQFLKSLKL